jgi:hypothetical protein
VGELVRLARSRRAVSRRPNDRGFSPAESAHRLPTGYRPRPRGKGHALAVCAPGAYAIRVKRLSIGSVIRVRRRNSWPGRPCSCATTAARKSKREKERFCV